MKKGNKKQVLKRIKKTLCILTVCDYLLLINLIMMMCSNGIMGKILDYIFVIY